MKPKPFNSAPEKKNAAKHYAATDDKKNWPQLVFFVILRPVFFAIVFIHMDRIVFRFRASIQLKSSLTPSLCLRAVRISIPYHAPYNVCLTSQRGIVNVN